MSPDRNDVFQEIVQTKTAAQDIIRRRYLKELHEYTGRDTIVYATAFTSKKLPDIPNFLISITSEDIQGFMSALHGLNGESLDLVLHSPGGSLEAAEQIVGYLRGKYKHIRAIVPQNAMSAATMIACACDTILMGKHSAIGPIDPQITFPTRSGHFTAPAQAILDEFERARSEIIANPAVAPLWVSKMRDYPPGLLNMCQSTIALSIEKVAEWLAKYMFAGETNADEKALAIAHWLGDANVHKTHGRPISIDKAKSKGMRVDELETDQVLQEKVMAVFHATLATLEVTQCMKFVENHNGKGWFVNVQIEKHPAG